MSRVVSRGYVCNVDFQEDTFVRWLRHVILSRVLKGKNTLSGGYVTIVGHVDISRGDMLTLR